MAKSDERERSTNLEKYQRVNEVAKAILKGYSNRKILIQYLSETYKWNVTERTIDTYIADAKAILSNIDENELAFEKSLALNRLDALYTMNYKIHDFRECRTIIESRAKILGFSAPEKIDHTTNGKDLQPVQIEIVKNENTGK